MAPARTRVFAPATVSIRVGVVATARWCHVPLTGRAGEPRGDAVGNDGGTVITVTSVAALLLARTRTIVRTCCRPPITLIIPRAAPIAALLAPTSHLLSPTVAALIVTSAATVVTPLLAPTIVASVTPAAIVAIVPWLGLRLGLGSGSGLGLGLGLGSGLGLGLGLVSSRPPPS